MDDGGTAVASVVVGSVTSSPADHAFADFYRRERVGVARALELTLGDVDLAVEAADEAMVRAYQRWAQVRTLESPAGWVYRVGLNWSRSALRRRRRAPFATSHVTAADAHVGEADVLVALRELDLRQRSVVVLRLYLGLTEAETAEALGIPAGTVKSRLHRATAVLRSRLAHLRPDGPPILATQGEQDQ